MRMIQSKADYLQCLEADRVALERKAVRAYSRAYWVGRINKDYIWEFQRLLRQYEWLLNTATGPLDKLAMRWVYRRYRRMGLWLGFTIPPNVFGPGLSIAHPGTIVVNKHARVGAHCRLHVCVNIGTAAGYRDRAPQIGNNVYIGPGAKIYGDITIADNVAIGANAVVNKSITESNIAVGGVPARKISDIDISEILPHYGKQEGR